MKKIIIIDDKYKSGIVKRAVKKIFNAQEKNFIGGKAVYDFVNKETPDFLFLNSEKPVNGDGMMRTLGSLNENYRLRVTIYNLGNFNAFALSLLPFEFFDSIESFAENLFNKFSKKFPLHRTN